MKNVGSGHRLNLNPDSVTKKVKLPIVPVLITRTSHGISQTHRVQPTEAEETWGQELGVGSHLIATVREKEMNGHVLHTALSLSTHTV